MCMTGAACMINYLVWFAIAASVSIRFDVRCLVCAGCIGSFVQELSFLIHERLKRDRGLLFARRNDRKKNSAFSLIHVATKFSKQVSSARYVRISNRSCPEWYFQVVIVANLIFVMLCNVFVTCTLWSGNKERKRKKLA